MIKIEKIWVGGFEGAMRGMRNPKNSWDKGDTKRRPLPEDSEDDTVYSEVTIGPNDRKLAHTLFVGGSEHRKYLRMCHIQMDVTAPLYWWKECDTYKVGTTSDSCSTMHKIHSKKFVLDDFSCEHLLKLPDPNNVPRDIDGQLDLCKWLDREAPCYICVGMDVPFSPIEILKTTIRILNRCRELYLETKDKKYWWQMIQLLPSSYNQKRTLDFNYETAATIIRQRSGHKLDEWHIFVDALKELPYMKEFMEGEDG
jgi:hypothetical protein